MVSDAEMRKKQAAWIDRQINKQIKAGGSSKGGSGKSLTAHVGKCTAKATVSGKHIHIHTECPVLKRARKK